jgi:hypothetical protein
MGRLGVQLERKKKFRKSKKFKSVIWQRNHREGAKIQRVDVLSVRTEM